MIPIPFSVLIIFVIMELMYKATLFSENSTLIPVLTLTLVNPNTNPGLQFSRELDHIKCPGVQNVLFKKTDSKEHYIRANLAFIWSNRCVLWPTTKNEYELC